MDAEYIAVEIVAQLLAVSTRHAHRACHKAGVRSSKAGKRTLYHRLDVEQLAVELGAAYRTVEPTPAPAVDAETAATSSTPPSTALVPYDALQRQLADVQRELVELKAMVATLVERQDAPNVETQPRKLAWWRRLFGGE